MGLIAKATEIVHRLLAEKVNAGDTVVDTTSGQGKDTCFLARLVGESGRVWAFDIQEKACKATQECLEKQGLAEQVNIIIDNHADMEKYPIEDVAAIVFNLGWLPQENHSIVTNKHDTLVAVVSSLNILRDGGVIIIVSYPGHKAGFEEYIALKEYLQQLPAAKALTMEISFPNKSLAPIILVIEKQN